MPQKTIYVREEDLPIFEEAENLSKESLSSVIVSSLKRFIDQKKAESLGMGTVRCEVGEWFADGTKNVRVIQFNGRLLAEYKEPIDWKDNKIVNEDEWKIYQSMKGNFLLWCKHRRKNFADANYQIFPELPGFDEIFIGDVESIGGGVETEIPSELLTKAKENLGEEPVQILDI